MVCVGVSMSLLVFDFVSHIYQTNRLKMPTQDIFENPQFFINGPSAGDVRQGRDGDCWLMAALCTTSNKEELIHRFCVAIDEKIGVYWLVFYRGTPRPGTP
jgi:hypothetical protein